MALPCLLTLGATLRVMILGHIAGIWRYPLKSVQGETLAECRVELRGVTDDRRWAVYGTDGGIGSGKRTRRFRAMPGLLDLQARVMADGIAVDFPDGRKLSGPGTELDEAISAWLGEPTTVRAETGIRHHDDSPLHLVSAADCRGLGQRLADGAAVDARRFRPNLVIEPATGSADNPSDPLDEAALAGARIAIGTIVLRLTKRTERCVMIGMAQPGLPANPSLLRVLAEPGTACFGVYAQVESVGTIRCGDPIERL